MTNKIERWNAAFASMDDRAQDEALRMAEGLAQAHPKKARARKSKRLVLVASNLLVGPAQGLGQAQQVSPPTLVSSVK
jgi:hypothetical protein